MNSIWPTFFHMACVWGQSSEMTRRSNSVASFTTSQRSISPANRRTQSSMRPSCSR